MGTVVQLPVGIARSDALKRLAAANETEKTQTETKKVPSAWAFIGHKIVGAAGLMVALSARSLSYGTGLAAGLLASMLWMVSRPVQAFVGLLTLASLIVIAIQWHSGWPDTELVAQCSMIICAATLILFLLQLSIRFLFAVERRLKGTR